VTNERKLSQACLSVLLENLEEVITDLLDTAEHLHGKHKECPEAYMDVAGLAANQLGHYCRAFIINNGQGRFIPIVNPEVVFRGKGKSHDWESCFSLPGKRTWKSRFKKVQLKSELLAWGEGWKPKSKSGLWTFRNFQARVVQHEMDHFDGILI
jgi:peptide deformylase